jgi:macrolide transport system ATP-binding/permease protein
MPLLRRAWNLLSRSRVDREIDLELASHIEMRMEDNLAAGMTPEDARRDALLRFGNRTATKERVVNMDLVPLLASVWSDVSYTSRQLVRNPGFALTAILVLTLGICASIAIFAFVDAVLITPLPYKNPSRLVGLFESTPLGPRFHLSHLDYLDWKKLNHVFTSVEAFDQNTLALKTATGVQRTDGVTVGAGFFRLLGITPVLGRDFRPGEDTAGAPRTVILTYSAWEKRFGKEQDVLGKTVILNDASSVIVGVLPQWFQFAPAGPAEFWMPLQSSPKPQERGEHGMLAFARVRDGVSLQEASADMSAIARQLAKQYPDADEVRGATVVPLTELIVGSLRPTLLLLLSGAALLLLIACVNVSGLQLVRLQSRQRELAPRGLLRAADAATNNRSSCINSGRNFVGYRSRLWCHSTFTTAHPTRHARHHAVPQGPRPERTCPALCRCYWIGLHAAAFVDRHRSCSTLEPAVWIDGGRPRRRRYSLAPSWREHGRGGVMYRDGVTGRSRITMQELL